KVLSQNFPKVFFGTSIRRSIHVGQIEVRYAAVKSPPHNCPAGFKDIYPAKVLPSTQRYRRQCQPALATTAKLHPPYRFSFAKYEIAVSPAIMLFLDSFSVA